MINFQTTLDRLISFGAVLNEPIFDRSQGQGKLITASVYDPFGNILGICKNDNFTSVHERLGIAPCASFVDQTV